MKKDAHLFPHRFAVLDENLQNAAPEMHITETV
jgi:hypothetical protein